MKKSAPEVPEWFKTRGYSHFDDRVSRAWAWEYVNDAERIAMHPFTPFIRYIKEVSRYKSKKNKNEIKEREINYASHLDSFVYAKYANELNVALESRLQASICKDTVIAYRKLGRSNIEFAHEVFTEIRARGTCTALAFDVTKFFDSLDHGLLRDAWIRTLGVARLSLDHYKVYRSLTKYAYVNRQHLESLLEIPKDRDRSDCKAICDRRTFRKKVRRSGLVKKNSFPFGIPQGSPISATLSNVYMLDFDEVVAAELARSGGVYRRYCDDILIVCHPNDADRLQDYLIAEIKKLKLDINKEKVERADFVVDANGKVAVQGGRPLQYLGLLFDGESAHIRHASLSRYYRRMKKAVYRASRCATKNKKNKRMFKKKLYERYSHLGNDNFISYANRAKNHTQSGVITSQLSSHWRILHKECVFRAKTDTDSGRNRTPVPEEIGQRFRREGGQFFG